MPDTPDELCMRSALLLAHTAAAEGEVPVGCVVVHDGRIIARAYNQRELLADPTAHAEMIALTQAAAALGSWRLDGASLYVTLEPCAMCAGAIIQARVPRLVFAAADPKAGAAGSVVDLFEPGLFNHDVEVVSGVLAAEAASLLSAFFRNLRR